MVFHAEFNEPSFKALWQLWIFCEVPSLPSFQVKVMLKSKQDGLRHRSRYEWEWLTSKFWLLTTTTTNEKGQQRTRRRFFFIENGFLSIRRVNWLKQRDLPDMLDRSADLRDAEELAEDNIQHRTSPSPKTDALKLICSDLLCLS